MVNKVIKKQTTFKHFLEIFKKNDGFSFPEIIIGGALIGIIGMALSKSSVSALKAEKKLDGYHSIRTIGFLMSYEVLNNPTLFPPLDPPDNNIDAAHIYFKCFNKDHNFITPNQNISYPSNGDHYHIKKVKITKSLGNFISSKSIDLTELKGTKKTELGVNAKESGDSTGFDNDLYCDDHSEFRFIGFIFTYKNKSLIWVYSMRSKKYIESAYSNVVTNNYGI